MICTNCGAQMEETATVCPNCGVPCDSAESPMQQAVTAEKRSGSGFKIALSLFLVGVLVGGCIWFLTHLTKKRNPVQQAAARSVSLLGEYLGELPNLTAIRTNFDAIADSDTAAFDMALSNSQTFGSIETNKKFSFSAAADKKTGKARFGTDLATLMDLDSDQSLPLTAYIDKDVLYILFPLLEEGEALAFPLQDFAQQFNDSALAKLMGDSLPDTDFTQLFSDKASMDNMQSMETALQDLYGEDWTNFRNSVEWVEYKNPTAFGAEGETYLLQWEQTLLDSMCRKAENDLASMEEPETFEELRKLYTPELSAKFIVYGLGTLTAYVEDPIAYVEDGALLGISFEIPLVDLRVVIRLCGEKNPWELLRIEVQRKQKDDFRTVGTATLASSNIEAKLRLELTIQSMGRDIGSAVLVYDDENGKIFMESLDGEPVENQSEITLVPTEGGLRFAFRMDEGNREDGSFVYSNLVNIEFAMSSKATDLDAPEISKKTEILKLTEDELNALGERIDEKAAELFGNIFTSLGQTDLQITEMTPVGDFLVPTEVPDEPEATTATENN